MDLQIKTLEYAPGAMLEYIARNDAIVYCGITNKKKLPPEASTTNAATEILKAIAKDVGKPVSTLKFFELATSTSWVLEPGEYDFQGVKLHGRREDGFTWSRTIAPKIVLDAFRHRIGGTMRRYVPGPEGTTERRPWRRSRILGDPNF